MLQAHWTTEALVLLVEDRQCQQCGATHTAPSPHMRVRLRATGGATRTVGLETVMWTGDRIPALPREVTHVAVPVPHCHECFERTAPTGTTPARRMTTEEIDAQRKTDLPDFGMFATCGSVGTPTPTKQE